MKKNSHRPNREQIKTKREADKQAQRKLRQDGQDKGLKEPSHATISNRKCEYKSVEQERCARNEAVAEKIRIFRAKPPVLLKGCP